MERRVLLAIFLSLPDALPLAGGDGEAGAEAGHVLVPAPAHARRRRRQSQPSGGQPPRPALAPQPPSCAPPPAATALIGDTIERDVRVETADVIAVFTNRGARLKSWRLKHYLDQEKQPQELVVSLVSAAPAVRAPRRRRG